MSEDKITKPTQEWTRGQEISHLYYQLEMLLQCIDAILRLEAKSRTSTGVSIKEIADVWAKIQPQIEHTENLIEEYERKLKNHD